MYRIYLAALLPSALGAGLALIALAAPFGSTGVDGTIGAFLAFTGTIAASLTIIVIMARPLSRHWFITLNVLAMLAATLTAIAGFFLMQTLLTAAMVATFVVVAFVFFSSGRRST